MILLKKLSIEALKLCCLNRGFERLTLQGERGGDEEDCKVNSKERGLSSLVDGRIYWDYLLFTGTIYSITRLRFLCRIR